MGWQSNHWPDSSMTGCYPLSCGVSCEDCISLGNKIKRISSVDLLVKRMLKLSWDFVGVVRLVVTRGVDSGLMRNGM